ncbi:hypothetical protein SEA_MALIBO_13 [Gordonia phage Malibo]|nr:hypothetical protein SEA_MALIBO_13 [Gordonia phage Malibo]
MIAVRFTADHGPRSEGDVVRYDDASAAHLVDAGVAEYVDETAESQPAEVEELAEVEVEHTPTGAEAPQTASADDGD